MAFTASITAMLGLDTKGFDQGLQNAAAKSKSFAAQTHGASGAGGHGLLMSDHRVARQVNNTAKQLLAGGSAADVFSAGLEGLERSLHVPLPALIALGAAAIGIEKLAEAREEFHKLEKSIDSLYATGGRPPQMSGMDEIKTHIAEVDKVLEETQKHFRSNMGYAERVLDHFNEGANPFAQARKEYEEKIREIKGQQKRAAGDLAEKYGNRAELATESLSTGAEEMALKKIHEGYQEKHGALPAEFGANSDEYKHASDALDKQEAAETEAAKRKFAEGRRALDLEAQIGDIKSKGADVDTESARARLAFAKHEKDILISQRPDDADALKGADVKVSAAQEAFDLAQKTTAAHKEQLASESKLAWVRGTSDEKRMASLDDQDKILSDQLQGETPGSDKAKDLDAQREKVRGAKADLQRGMDDHAAALDDSTRIDGSGMGSEARAQQARDAERERLRQKLYNATPGESKEINAKIAGIDAANADKKFSDDQTLAAAKERNAELALEAQGMHTLAGIAAQRAQTERDVSQALRDGKNELAAQIAQAGARGVVGGKIAQSMETPEHRMAARQRAHAEEVAATLALARDKETARRKATHGLTRDIDKPVKQPNLEAMIRAEKERMLKAAGDMAVKSLTVQEFKTQKIEAQTLEVTQL